MRTIQELQEHSRDVRQARPCDAYRDCESVSVEKEVWKEAESLAEFVAAMTDETPITVDVMRDLGAYEARVVAVATFFRIDVPACEGFAGHLEWRDSQPELIFARQANSTDGDEDDWSTVAVSGATKGAVARLLFALGKGGAA